MAQTEPRGSQHPMTPPTMAGRKQLTSTGSFRGRLVEPTAFAFAGAAYAGLIGYLAFFDRRLAVGGAALGLVLGLLAGNVARLAILATAGVWLVTRAPGNISVSDVLVASAGAAALASGAAQAVHPRGRMVLRTFAFYLGTLVVTLGFNQSLRSDLEWFHRIALVAGGIWVGAWLVSLGLHRPALRLLLLVTTFVATVALVEGLATGLRDPAQPLNYQKNFVGSIVASVLLIVIAAHRELELSPRILRISGVLLAGGLVATHSRGAMVGASVGVLVWFFKTPAASSPRLRRVAVVGAIGLAAYTAVSVKNELAQNTGHSSLTQRTQIEQAAHRLWQAHPLTGVGLRFFKTPRYAGYSQPNNIFDEVLAEAGLPGLLGFIVFILGAFRGMAARAGPLAVAGLSVMTARFVHGLFDIYWVAGTTAIAWIVAGMGLAISPPTQRPARSL